MERESTRSKEEILIVGLNWLGDSVMAMPAIQAYRRAFPEKRLIMLAKPKLAELWPMHPAIDETWVCPETISGIWKTAGQIRGRQFSAAFILPKSFRSALIPFLGRVPQRIGLRGHFRGGLLTQIIPLPQNTGQPHQQYEYMAVLGQEADRGELPILQISNPHIEKARATLGNGKERWIGLFPGAARGPAKIWPADYFADLGRILRKNRFYNLVIFGSAADQCLCARIGARIGGDILNLAGRTSLPELAAFLSLCSFVVGNDSGGIHLAAAAGAAVIVIFGITDPAKTRPLGRQVIVLQDSPFRARDIPRHSAAAEKSLKKISPELVAETVRSLIECP